MYFSKAKLGETQILYTWNSIWQTTMSIVFLSLQPVHHTVHTDTNTSFQMYLQRLLLKDFS